MNSVSYIYGVSGKTLKNKGSDNHPIQRTSLLTPIYDVFREQTDKLCQYISFLSKKNVRQTIHCYCTLCQSYEISISSSYCVKRLFFCFDIEIIYSFRYDFYCVTYTDIRMKDRPSWRHSSASQRYRNIISSSNFFFAPWLKKNQIYGFMMWFIPFKFISIELYEMEGEFKWKIWYAWTVDITNNKITDIQWTWLIKSC